MLYVELSVLVADGVLLLFHVVLFIHHRREQKALQRQLRELTTTINKKVIS